MPQKLTAILLCLLLAGCAELQQGADAVARDSARAAVDQVLVTRFPGVDGNNVTPYTDCLINNASRSEIASLARAAVAGVTDATVSLIAGMARRPETAACLVTAGLALTT